MKEKIIIQAENYEKEYLKTNEEFESAKYLLAKNNEIEQKFIFCEREKLLEEKNLLIEKRKNLQSAMQLNFDSDIKIRKIITESETKGFDVNESIKIFAQCSHTCKKPELVNRAKRILITKKEESIKEMISKKQFKDKATVEKMLDELSLCNIKLSSEILLKLKEIN